MEIWNKDYSIRDLARECGVSVATVSKALNNYPGVRENTRRMILQAADSHGYIPNATAKLLKQADNRTIVILVRDPYHPHFNMLIREYMESSLMQAGYEPVIRYVNDKDPLYVALNAIKECRACGMIILGSSVLGREEEVEQLGIPTVLYENYGDPSPHRNISTFFINETVECYRVTRFLQERGAERIVFLTTEDSGVTVGGLRTAGYRQAMREQGTDDPGLVVVVKDSYYTSGYEAMRELLGRGVKLSAVLSVSDRLSMGCCRALHDSGRRIPDDVMVAGFDASEFTDYHVPSLTTVALPKKDSFRDSVQHLLERLTCGAAEQNRCYSGAILEKESTRRREERS